MVVVVAIVGLLVMVVYVSVGDARGKARDSIRQGDLEQVQLAMKLYFEKCGDYRVRETCASGAYYGDNGSGWLNYDGYAGSAGSVMDGLIAHGLLRYEIKDPTGAVQHTGSQSGYMVAAEGTAYTLWANLEKPSDADIATLDTCALDDYDNFDAAFPEEDRMNYCVGN